MISTSRIHVNPVNLGLGQLGKLFSSLAGLVPPVVLVGELKILQSMAELFVLYFKYS